jgi:hypothetical protein
MRNHKPHADYVVLLWCRHCGHCATRPVEPALTVEYVRERARCARCGRKWIGAVQMYEPRLGLGPGLLTCEVQLIASAVRTAAEAERRAADALAHGEESGLRARHLAAAGVYSRLAEMLSREASSRERPAVPPESTE